MNPGWRDPVRFACGIHAERMFCWYLALTLTLIATCAGCSSQLTVHVLGNRLADGNGHPIRLLGVNRSGAEYACIQGLGLIAGPTGERAVAAMRSWQINAVRIPLNEDCWLGINGAPRRYSGARYRAAIGAYVRLLHRANLYVILDLHWNAPGSALAVGQQPMADLDHAPAFWRSVARAFKRDPAVLFDLYNEPHAITWQCWRDGCRLPQGWRAAGMQALVDAVRSTGARQPIIVTGLDHGNDLSSWLQYRPHDPADQLVAGFHAYDSLHCANTDCWDDALKPVAQSAPVVTAELGDSGCSHAFSDDFMSWADAVGVSYLAWNWGPFGCGAPSLISSWSGQPTGYGEGVRAHLLGLRFVRPRSAPAERKAAHG